MCCIQRDPNDVGQNDLVTLRGDVRFRRSFCIWKVGTVSFPKTRVPTFFGGVFYSVIAERSGTQRNGVVQNLYSARFDPEESVYISAWCIPFRMIFAPFERSQSQLSIGAKINQNGGHHAEIQPRLVKGVFPEEYLLRWAQPKKEVGV